MNLNFFFGVLIFCGAKTSAQIFPNLPRLPNLPLINNFGLTIYPNPSYIYSSSVFSNSLARFKQSQNYLMTNYLRFADAARKLIYNYPPLPVVQNIGGYLASIQNNVQLLYQSFDGIQTVLQETQENITGNYSILLKSFQDTFQFRIRANLSVNYYTCLNTANVWSLKNIINSNTQSLTGCFKNYIDDFPRFQRILTSNLQVFAVFVNKFQFNSVVSGRDYNSAINWLTNLIAQDTTANLLSNTVTLIKNYAATASSDIPTCSTPILSTFQTNMNNTMNTILNCL